mmetsp:Transcript_144338/g.375795  ORF Transcript_144338/g.375795 Transcript_144338/m.375795 type:complete len:210 (+) Transcript_144338:1201-1830(+)
MGQAASTYCVGRQSGKAARAQGCLQAQQKALCRCPGSRGKAWPTAPPRRWASRRPRRQRRRLPVRRRRRRRRGQGHGRVEVPGPVPGEGGWLRRGGGGGRMPGSGGQGTRCLHRCAARADPRCPRRARRRPRLPRLQGPRSSSLDALGRPGRRLRWGLVQWAVGGGAGTRMAARRHPSRACQPHQRRLQKAAGAAGAGLLGRTCNDVAG